MSCGCCRDGHGLRHILADDGCASSGDVRQTKQRYPCSYHCVTQPPRHKSMRPRVCMLGSLIEPVYCCALLTTHTPTATHSAPDLLLTKVQNWTLVEACGYGKVEWERIKPPRAHPICWVRANSRYMAIHILNRNLGTRPASQGHLCTAVAQHPVCVSDECHGDMHQG